MRKWERTRRTRRIRAYIVVGWFFRVLVGVVGWVWERLVLEILMAWLAWFVGVFSELAVGADVVVASTVWRVRHCGRCVVRELVAVTVLVLVIFRNSYSPRC
jgi:hypothetical protein